MIGTTYWVEVILSAEIGTAEVRHSESGVSVMLEQGESWIEQFPQTRRGLLSYHLMHGP